MVSARSLPGKPQVNEVKCIVSAGITCHKATAPSPPGNRLESCEDWICDIIGGQITREDAMDLARLDDLTRYVLHNFGNLMTEQEFALYRWLQVEANMESWSPQNKRVAEEHWKPADDQLTKALKEDPVAFLQEIRDRIIKDHDSDIIINRCPRCNGLVATPKAKQCKHCGHDWH